MNSHVNYFRNLRGQLKIQQMAFVLVALVVFFGIVALFYFSFTLSNLRGDVSSLQEEEAKELVRKLASSPEFSFSSQCTNCIDLDKIMALNSRQSYKEFWNLDFLQIERIYPESQKKECEKSIYPDCNTITIISKEKFGSPKTAFVSLCRWEQQKGGYIKCELGRIYASGKDLEKK